MNADIRPMLKVPAKSNVRIIFLREYLEKMRILPKRMTLIGTGIIKAKNILKITRYMTMVLLLSYLSLSTFGASGYYNMFDWRTSPERISVSVLGNYMETTIYADIVDKWHSPYGIHRFLFGWFSLNVVFIRNLETYFNLPVMNWFPDTAYRPAYWYGGVRSIDFGVKYQVMDRRNWGLSFLMKILFPFGENQITHITVPALAPEYSDFVDSISVREGLFGSFLGVSSGYDFNTKPASKVLFNAGLKFGYDLSKGGFGLGESPLLLGLGLFMGEANLDAGFELKYFGPIFDLKYLVFSPMMRYSFYDGGVVLAVGTNISYLYKPTRFYLNPKDPEHWEWNSEIFLSLTFSPVRFKEFQENKEILVKITGFGKSDKALAEARAEVSFPEEGFRRPLLTLIVIDSLTGKPLSDVKVSIRGRVDKESKTDDSGMYRDSTLPPSNYLITLRKSEEDYQPVDVGVSLYTDAVLKVKMFKKVSNLLELAGVVYFDVDRATLKQSYKSMLDSIGNILLKEPYSKVLIRAHADRRGGAFYNELLTEKRASVIKEYIIARFGISKGLSKDRRVEIYLMMPEKVKE